MPTAVLVVEPVTADGGSVGAASGPDGGTGITLRLPTAATRAAGPARGPGQSSDVARKTNTPRGI